jgi:hypothetical protein
LPTSQVLAHAVMLLASALGTGPPSSVAAVSAYLAPVDEDVVGEAFTTAQVEKKLRERLSRRTGLRLVDEPERGAMRLQVTGCTRGQEARVTRDREPQPPVTLPKGGTTVIRDESYGVSVENRTFVILSVRVVWQDEAREVASGEKDLSLDDAVAAVVRELEKLAKGKRPRSGP